MDIQVKFNDWNSWTESDQAHYFGCSLSSQETKEDSCKTGVRQGSSGFQRDVVGVGRRLPVHCGEGVPFTIDRSQFVSPLLCEYAISFNPQTP